MVDRCEAMTRKPTILERLESLDKRAIALCSKVATIVGPPEGAKAQEEAVHADRLSHVNYEIEALEYRMAELEEQMERLVFELGG